jgi:hypothetical protein
VLIATSPSRGVSYSSGSVGLAWPCYTGGGMGLLVGLYFVDMSEVWML